MTKMKTDVYRHNRFDTTLTILKSRTTGSETVKTAPLKIQLTSIDTTNTTQHSRC